MPEKQIGEVENMSCDLKKIEWRISDFFSVTADQYYSPYTCPPFTFAGSLWHLRLYLPSSSAGFIEIFLRTNVEREYSVEYYFGFKREDGNVEQLVSGILKKDIACSSHTIHLIKETELSQRKSELVPKGALTIICTLNSISAISNSIQHIVLDQTKILKLIKLDTLSENFKGIFTNGEYCDTTLQLENKEFKAHKVILAARSSVFAAMFKHETSEKQTGIVNISDCDPDSFEEFLEFLYCGKLENVSFRSAFQLYKTADKYDVQELKKFCIIYMKQNLTVENVCEVISLAEEREQTDLFDAAQNFFNRNLNEIFVSAGWKDLFKKNFSLANKLLIQMASKVKVVE